MKIHLNIERIIKLKKELNDRKNLSLVDTTSERNGYPSNTEEVIVGFSNFEAAENFAKRYNLTTVLLHKRDGWGFWARLQYNLYKPLEGSRGGKVMSINEDTHSYIIGVACSN